MPEPPEMNLADAAQAIGKRLIHEHHPHLSGAEIIYVFTSQHRKRCDRVRLGSATKLNALQRFLSSGMETVEGGHDFLILIDKGYWEILSSAQQMALIDHELMHCTVFVAVGRNPKQWRLYDHETDDLDAENVEWRYGMRGHDVEEFADVLKRHGWWKPDAREKGFGEIALQIALPKAGTSAA